MKKGIVAAAAPWLAVACLVLITGCGLRIDFSSTPPVVQGGQTVNFSLGLTNPSTCPVGDVEALVVPFVPENEIDNFLGPEFGNLFSAFCRGESVDFGDIVCRIEDGVPVCELENASSTGPSGESTFDTPLGPVTCHHEPGKLRCRVPQLNQATGANAAFLAPLTCVPDLGGIFCSSPSFAASESQSANFSQAAPFQFGTYFNIVIAGALDRGVCKSGVNQANPCGSDADCGNVPGSCGTGICTLPIGSTGNGCNVTGECGMNETCVQCDANTANLLPFACSVTSVTSSAPAITPLGVLASILALVTAGFFGLQRLRRDV